LFLGTESCSTISQFISLTYLVEISDLGHSIKTATNTALKQQEIHLSFFYFLKKYFKILQSPRSDDLRLGLIGCCCRVILSSSGTSVIGLDTAANVCLLPLTARYLNQTRIMDYHTT